MVVVVGGGAGGGRGERVEHCLGDKHLLSQHNLLNSIDDSYSRWFQ